MAEILKKKPHPTQERRPYSSPVIESEVFDASRKARTIVLDAEERARNLVAEGENQVSDKFEEARRQGFEAGTQAGLERFEAAIIKVNREYDELLSQAEEQLLALSTEIARKLIQKELSLNPRVIVEIVRKALIPMNRKRSITLRVHPDDQKVLESSRAELMDVLIHQPHIIFIADPDLSRGSCIVETEHGMVDARLERQFAHLAQLVTGKAEDLHGVIEPAAPVAPKVSVPEVVSDSNEDETAELNQEEVETFEADEAAEEFETLQGDQEVDEALDQAFDDETPTEEPENILDDMEKLAKQIGEKEDLDELLANLDSIISDGEESK